MTIAHLLSSVLYLVVWCVVLFEYLFIRFRRTIGDHHDCTVTLRATAADIGLQKATTANERELSP